MALAPWLWGWFASAPKKGAQDATPGQVDFSPGGAQRPVPTELRAVPGEAETTEPLD